MQSLVAFGAGAALGPLLTYAWQRGLDKRLLHLLSSTEHNTIAWAYDLLTLTRGHLDHISDLPLYAEVDSVRQQVFAQGLKIFLFMHHGLDTLHTQAAWPGALAGLFAGVLVQWPLERLAIQTSPDPFWSACVRQYKSVLRDLYLSTDAQSSLREDLAFAAARLAVYAVTQQKPVLERKQLGRELLDLTIYYD